MCSFTTYDKHTPIIDDCNNCCFYCDELCLFDFDKILDSSNCFIQIENGCDFTDISFNRRTQYCCVLSPNLPNKFIRTNQTCNEI